MKKMKKILAMALAMAMVLGMSVTTFAAGGTAPTEPFTPTPVTDTVKTIDHPSSSDTVDVKIGGITRAPDITLYQIAYAEYGGEGGNNFIRYRWVEANEIDDKAPTSGQIADFANAIVNGKLKVPAFSVQGTLSGDVYTATVPAGAYIAVITGADDGSVYNPILLSASYSATDEGGTEFTGGSINIEDAKYLNGAAAVAKKSTPSINKTINGETVETDTNITATSPEGTNTTSTPGPTTNATVAVGDSVEYTITPELPSYPAEARNKKLAVSDRASAGLTFQFATLKLTLDGVETTRSEAEGKVTFTYDGNVVAYAKEVTENNTTGFDMTFVYDNLIYNDGAAVHVPSITYNAIVNDAAVVGADGNPNTTTLYYTNQPNTDSNWDPSDVELPEGEDVKEKTDKEIVYTYQLAFLKTGEGDDAKGLAGAVFGIYSDQACGEEDLVDIVTTNTNGYAVSSQVRAGNYYIKEITAPAGYSLNDDIFEVTANWTTVTTTIKGTTTRRTYTAKVEEAVNSQQVGWLDEDGGFYNLDTAVTYGRTPVSIDTGKALVPAYLKSETTTNNSESFTTENAVTGTATQLKNLSTGESATTIPNTKLSSLPSTGGIGTTIFTIGGCAIMIIAAGLYFASRRKTAK